MNVFRPGSTPKRVLLASPIGLEDCLRGVAPLARQRGWHLVADMVYTGVFPRGWKGDGIIAVMSHLDVLVPDILRAETPCVEITLSGDGAICPSIRADHVAVGRLAADYLHAAGYRSFAWAPFLHDRMASECFSGFRGRLRKLNSDCRMLPAAFDPDSDRRLADWPSRRRSIVAELKLLPRPTAILAANDSIAADILDVCRDLDIATPSEVGILGIGNNVALCESLPIALSSINLELANLALRAAEALDDMISGRSVPDITRVSPLGVTTRNSTGVDGSLRGLGSVRAMNISAASLPK